MNSDFKDQFLFFVFVQPPLTEFKVPVSNNESIEEKQREIELARRHFILKFTIIRNVSFSNRKKNDFFISSLRKRQFFCKFNSLVIECSRCVDTHLGSTF